MLGSQISYALEDVFCWIYLRDSFDRGLRLLLSRCACRTLIRLRKLVIEWRLLERCTVQNVFDIRFANGDFDERRRPDFLE